MNVALNDSSTSSSAAKVIENDLFLEFRSLYGNVQVACLYTTNTAIQ